MQFSRPRKLFLFGLHIIYHILKEIRNSKFELTTCVNKFLLHIIKYNSRPFEVYFRTKSNYLKKNFGFPLKGMFSSKTKYLTLS